MKIKQMVKEWNLCLSLWRSNWLCRPMRWLTCGLTRWLDRILNFYHIEESNRIWNVQVPFMDLTVLQSLTRLTSWILDISHQWLSYGRVFWDFKYSLMASVEFTAIINVFSLFYIITSLAKLTSCVLYISHQLLLCRRV